MKIISKIYGILVIVLIANTVGTANAAITTLYGNRAAFLSDFGAAPQSLQNFSGFNAGDNMDGVEFIPGISASTNLNDLEIFTSSGNNMLFAFTRNKASASYNISLTQPYTALGFDITAFNPQVKDPGFIDIQFADNDKIFDIPILATNATESDPLFFGIISNTAISSVSWHEAPELSGSCCEETGLDNFIAGSPVPVPAAFPMLLTALMSLGAVKYRRKKA